jgi:ribonuclease D
VFDTQIAAGCIGLKPQIGYAELANLLIGVTLAKGQTRTDWSKRPLTAANSSTTRPTTCCISAGRGPLSERLRELGREHWVREDCLALEQAELYEPIPPSLGAAARSCAARAAAARARESDRVWRERIARDRDLPRGWILADAAIFELAQAQPKTIAALRAVRSMPASFNEAFAAACSRRCSHEARTAPRTWSRARSCGRRRAEGRGDWNSTRSSMRAPPNSA